MSDTRPVHVVLAGSDMTTTPVTDEEWADIKAREQAPEPAGQDRAADAALIVEKAATDPAFAALARLLGIALPDASTTPTTPAEEPDA